jgi:hypothetical protein
MPKASSLRGARRRGNPGGIGLTVRTDIQNIRIQNTKKSQPFLTFRNHIHTGLLRSSQ